jgi:esterase/lipase superfamily enzyme
MRAVLLPALVVLFAACTPRGELSFGPAVEGVGDIEEVFVGTTRTRVPGTADFGSERSETMSFAMFNVSVPTVREPGEITWPRAGRPPDPATDFVTVGSMIFDRDRDFRRALAQAIRREDGEATIFVHGYNNNFAEGLYRVAQLSSDIDLPGETVQYAWPSAASALGYLTDRDSATFAKAGLADLIRQVDAAGAREITIVAHSMGAFLTMEALQQVALSDRRLLDRIGGVVLISPDIDIDVFRTQAQTIGELPQPFIIFTSEADRVLRLSARLTGQTDRLGTLADITRVDDLELALLDSTAFDAGSGHFNAAESPALIRILERFSEVRGAYDGDAAGRIGLLPGAVLTVQNATKVILSPVAELGEADF